MSFQLDYDLRKPNDHETNEYWLSFFSRDKLPCSKCGTAPAKFYSQLHHISWCENPSCKKEAENFVDSYPEKWPIPPDAEVIEDLSKDPNWKVNGD